MKYKRIESAAQLKILLAARVRIYYAYGNISHPNHPFDSLPRAYQVTPTCLEYISFFVEWKKE